MAIVKANAYGHGALQVAETAIEWGSNNLGTALLSEAVYLRKNGIKVPIVVFYPVFPEEVNTALDNDICLTVNALETAEYINQYAQKRKTKAKVHVNVDSGMGRGGIFYRNAKTVIRDIAKLKNLELTGLYTHFATSDSGDKKFAFKQLKRFQDIVSWTEKNKSEFEMMHAANSGAILSIPEASFDFVRPGISMYGYYPSKELEETVKLKPVMSLVGRISQIKTLPARTSLGYSRNYFTRYATRIALVPVGYADGYNRLLSNYGEGIIKGRKFQVCGRISMDSIMFDIGDNDDVETGDSVLLLGEESGNKIDMWRICNHLKTIPYEVTCSISERVPRIYMR